MRNLKLGLVTANTHHAMFDMICTCCNNLVPTWRIARTVDVWHCLFLHVVSWFRFPSKRG
jgi:hypothetical protein